MSGWWTAAIVWVIACVLILLLNLGAHQGHNEDDNDPRQS